MNIEERDFLEPIVREINTVKLSEFYDWMGSKWDSAFFPMKEVAKAVDRMNK